jgi:hypothetical protein
MTTLKIAIQKSGRLSEKSLQLLKDCGIKIANSDRKLKTAAANFPVEILFLRDDDIPQYVEQGVADIGILGENEVWENAVWVNQEEKLFFVPIWRNGNTAFMNDIAEQFNFTLEKDIDLSYYTGFTMVRNPTNRLVGQIWRACENHNHSIYYVVTNLLKKNEVDIHLSTKTSFLKPYKIDYYLDLDRIEEFTNVEPSEGFTGITENHISVVKYDMVKILIEVLMSENGQIDETLGMKSAEMTMPFKLAFNSLLNKKLLNKY